MECNLAFGMSNYVKQLKKTVISNVNALTDIIGQHLYTKSEIIDLILKDDHINEALRRSDERTQFIRDYLFEQRLETERFFNEHRLQVEQLLSDQRIEMRDLERRITRTITHQITRNVSFLISVLMGSFAVLHFLHLM